MGGQGFKMNLLSSLGHGLLDWLANDLDNIAARLRSDPTRYVPLFVWQSLLPPLCWFCSG